ncbi:bifunctional adenosylcobinamide kinase/adenosylcobinamide-phosphate guanylyltransferase [soil metagenome]
MITLVLGGTRSGKSRVAERLAGSAPPVTYVATARFDPDDFDHRSRIDAHRRRRPADWATVECSVPADLVAALRSGPGTLLVDSLGSWVTGHPDLTIDTGDLMAALAARTSPTILVSDEVGLAVHPPSELGRRFVDVVGSLNQELAAVSSRVVLVVAGRLLELPRGREDPASC